MHDKLFENQNEWSRAVNEKKLFEGYAEELGLNLEQFEDDYDSKEVEQKVARDQRGGNRLGVPGTPTFFLQGQRLSTPGSYTEFASLIQQYLPEMEEVMEEGMEGVMEESEG